jgi:tubulysin polyketide synthase-like protein
MFTAWRPSRAREGRPPVLLTAERLIADLHARGVRLEPRGDRLAAWPVSKLTAAELAILREHKAEVLAVLTRDPLSLWPASVPGLGVRQIVSFSPCLACDAEPPPDEIVTVGPLSIPVPGQRGTFVAFGGVALCRRHARGRAGDVR